MTRGCAAALMAAGLVALLGCRADHTPADLQLTDGVWVSEAGEETFVWEVQAADGGLAGVIHTLRDGRKETELPIDQVDWQPPQLVLHMHATGTRYRGEVDLSHGRIRGHVEHGGEQGPAMELHWRDPDGLPGLRARRDAAATAYRQPPSLDDGLITADAAAVGLPHAAVERLVADIVAGRAGVMHSLLLASNGQLVVEEYFHGYTRDHVHRLASVTKSVSSLLVGLAIDHGALTGVDQRLLPFFPDLQPADDPRWEGMTLHHLLTMTMGLDWNGADPHGTGPAFFQQVLQCPLAHDPGTRWAYQSANVNLLAGVLKQATGRHADQVLQEWLLQPLGITDHDWSFLATDGYRLMDGSLQLRPRDLLKLGMLLRDGGKWQGEQVVSADWIERSLTPHVQTDGREQYGYLWWLGELPGRDGPQPVVFANGHGSQFIVWMPGRDLLLVATGGNEDNGKHFALVELLAGIL
jgi:CubicO group peptidase (beta-lactamase class C family)